MATEMAKMWEVVESQHDKRKLNSSSRRAMKNEMFDGVQSLNGQQLWQMYDKWWKASIN